MKKATNIIIALFTTVLVSCDPIFLYFWDKPYEVYIINETDDTLYMTFPLLHVPPYFFDTTTNVIPSIPDEIDDSSNFINSYHTIYPKFYSHDSIIIINPHNCSKTIYKGRYSILTIGQDPYFLDTLRVYRKGSLVIEWYPPLRKMSKDSNSFYNENSWMREKDGADTIETITITEDDYGHAF